MISDHSSAPDARAQPLRILQVLEPSGGGSGRHFLDLCRALKQRGHHVEAVYSPLRAEDSFVRELKSIGLPAIHAIAMKRAPALSDFRAYKALRRVMKRGAPFDIVHGHSSKAGALARLHRPHRNVSRVYTPHAFRTMDPTLGKAGRAIFSVIELVLARLFTDHLICVSADEYRHARAMGMPDRKLSVIVNGVAPPPKDMASTLRASFGIPADALVFGFIGRLTRQKAPERLIEAFRHAATLLPQAFLVMVGSGELDAPVRAAIAASGLQNRIRLTTAFTGPQAVPAFDVLVLPSRYEAMSYVMLEAAAAGKPIISTDVGGASTVIEDGVNGLIVANDGDAAKLSAAMVRIADPNSHAPMTQAAEDGKSRYTLDTMIDRTEALYLRLATRR